MSLSRDQSPTVVVTGKEEALKKARCNTMETLQLQAAIVSERLPVEKIYHPFVCGPNNAIINKLMEETGARIYVPPLRVQKDEIVVSGEKDDVIWCKATIMRIYQEKKHKCQTMSVEIKKSQHKYVIGLCGSNLQEILDITGVSVEVPFSDSPSERITLRGEQEQLGLGLKMVYSKIMTGIQAASIISADVKAPEWLYKYIIGKEGGNIKRITQDSPKVHFKFLEGQDKIQVEGPTEEVKRAVANLKANVKSLQCRFDFADVEIEWQFLKHVIGKAGANINRIRNENGVRIRIPSDAENTSSIHIEGEREGVQRAKRQLMAMTKEITITIPHKLHASIIGVKGCLIHSIMDECGDVIIHFPPKGSTSDKIVIRGPHRCAHYARKHLLEFKKLKSISKANKRRFGFGKGSHKSDSKSYECSFCDKRFATKSGMEQHKRHHNTDFSDHECEFCTKRLFTKTKLRRQKSYAHCECYVCDKGYSIKTEPWQHLHHKDFRTCGCHVCDEEHSAEKETRQHLRNNRGARRQQCDVSAKGYSAKWDRWQHFRLHKDFRCYECDICDKGCSTQRELWQHLRDHKDFRPYECYICDEGWATKREFLQHLHCHEDSTRYECKICDMGYSTLISLWQHLRRHKDFNPYESCVFLERSINNIQVEEYKSLHEELTLYEIGGFEDKLSKLGELDLHKSHRCKVCSRRFSEISDLEQHKKYHKDFGTYQCDICDRRFSTMREMDEHRRYHKDFRLCQCCMICGSIFSTINEMEKHKVHHKGFHLNQCCMICGAIFSTMNEMEKHKSHHQDLSHQRCDICDKRFYTMSEVEQHKRHHQEIRPTQSDACDQIVSKKSGKDGHRRLYKCNVCDEKFSTKRAMKTHKREHQGSIPFSKYFFPAFMTGQ